MMRLIGYVGARDLSVITEEDIRCLDVINIAFGQVRDACMVWDGQACRPALERIRKINPVLKSCFPQAAGARMVFPRRR